MSLIIQVKTTLSGRAANKLLHVFIIYPTKSGPEVLLLYLTTPISISAPFSTKRHLNPGTTFQQANYPFFKYYFTDPF